MRYDAARSKNSMIFFNVYVVDFNFSFEGATAGNSIKCLHNSFLRKEVKDKRPQHFFF